MSNHAANSLTVLQLFDDSRMPLLEVTRDLEAKLAVFGVTNHVGTVTNLPPVPVSNTGGDNRIISTAVVSLSSQKRYTFFTAQTFHDGCHPLDRRVPRWRVRVAWSWTWEYPGQKSAIGIDNPERCAEERGNIEQ